WGWTDTFDGIPLSHTDVRFNLSDLPALRDCTCFTEPSALPVTDSTTGAVSWYVALGCLFLYEPDPHHMEGRIRMELVATDDHFASVRHVGPLLQAADALALGFSLAQLNGGNLFVVGADRRADAHSPGALVAEGPVAALRPRDVAAYLLVSPAGPVHYGNT